MFVNVSVCCRSVVKLFFFLFCICLCVLASAWRVDREVFCVLLYVCGVSLCWKSGTEKVPLWCFLCVSWKKASVLSHLYPSWSGQMIEEVSEYSLLQADLSSLSIVFTGETHERQCSHFPMNSGPSYHCTACLPGTIFWGFLFFFLKSAQWCPAATVSPPSSLPSFSCHCGYIREEAKRVTFPLRSTKCFLYVSLRVAAQLLINNSFLTS